MASARSQPISMISSTFIEFEEFKKKEAEAKKRYNERGKEKVGESYPKRKEPSPGYMAALQKESQPTINYMSSLYQDS